jgi:hypothetical protein
MMHNLSSHSFFLKSYTIYGEYDTIKKDMISVLLPQKDFRRTFLKKIIFLVKRAFGADYAKLFRHVGDIARTYHKSYVLILFDMLYCAIRYQAAFTDYELFGFASLPAEKRATFLTSGINNQFVRKFNQKDFRVYFDDKAKFLTRFASYVKRDWINVSAVSEAEFSDWAKKHKTFVIKPLAGKCGDGIRKIIVDEHCDIGKLYQEIRAGNSVLAEELIVQNNKMSELYPGSINTVRIVTFLQKDLREVSFLFSSVRIGNGGIVDNLNNGGMSSIVDLESGAILFSAADKNGVIYKEHPITHTKIAEFQIPYWNEILQLVASAAREIPEIRYVGWDIAITAQGPMLVEGNDHPGYDMAQMPGMLKNSEGILPRFTEQIQ